MSDNMCFIYENIMFLGLAIGSIIISIIIGSKALPMLITSLLCGIFVSGYNCLLFIHHDKSSKNKSTN